MFIIFFQNNISCCSDNIPVMIVDVAGGLLQKLLLLTKRGLQDANEEKLADLAAEMKSIR